MTGAETKEQGRLLCEKCGEPLQEGEQCYQLRAGYIDDVGEFVPEQDTAYFCADCGVERGNF